ncbi:DUF2254 domain-containing protein [Stakelama sediminis]|uniref:DUF2254 domain-containing protein n=1 Tax=Stakelama sediminis TaxID=463200 RepID=UPI001FE7D7AD|nr:DUF2254 domain-containing protein [Stakelama sediminis]
MRKIAEDLNSSYWFLPAVMTVGAIFLSLITYAIDVRMGQHWVQEVAWIHGSKPDGARSLLSTIAGSMISVAGTVFAITIAAVVYASGNYGPRLLTNFMSDRGNKFTLGTFIATFVYCLLVLRTIRSSGEGGESAFVPEVSLIVAMALTLLSVGVLVFFLHHVPDSIRINSVVSNIGERAMREIEGRFPDPDRGALMRMPPAAATVPVRARKTGYVEVIDFDTLAGVAQECDVRIRLTVRPGDFVHPAMPIAEVEGKDALADRVERAVHSAFAVGEFRTPRQDIEYSLDELVEIALRALSPGINDPFTAITCMHWLSAATAQLAMRNLECDVDQRPYGEHGVYAVPDDFDHFVRRGFGSVRASAAENAIASRMFVEGLSAAAQGDVSPLRVAALRREARLLLEQAEHTLAGPTLDELRAAVEQFAPVA